MLKRKKELCLLYRLLNVTLILLQQKQSIITTNKHKKENLFLEFVYFLIHSIEVL